LSRELGTHPIRADVLLQLGRLDHLCGHLPAAVDRFAEALTCAPSHAQALEIRLRRLLVLLDMNHPALVRQEAESLLQEVSLGELPEELVPLVRFVRGLLEETDEDADTDERQAFQAAARGDVPAARRLYRRAVAGEPSPERRARLALALGLLALAEDDRNEARSWLRQAEGPARSVDLPEVLGRALQGQGRVAAELDGDDEAARPLFEEAVTLFEVQAAQFSSVRDAMLYRRQQEGVLRHLLAAACRRGDGEAVFRYQELDRGRLLLDLWQSAGSSARIARVSDTNLQALQKEIDQCEAELESLPHTAEEAECRKGLIRTWEKLQQQRDRLLEGFLADRQRPASAVLPRLPTLDDLRQVLPGDMLCVAPSLVGDELYLLVVYSSWYEPARLVRVPGSADALTEALTRLRDCLTTQAHRYKRGLLRPADRAELDGCLDDLARGPLGQALFKELAGYPRPLLWIPDGPLHGLPVHALRHEGRYLIEDVEVVQSFSGALFVHQARSRRRRGWWRPALVVSESAEVLPSAEAEGKGVAASFFRSRILHGPSATRAAVRAALTGARIAHFACHADFDARHPLAATLRLPSGEALHAAEWFDEPVNGLALATLSACRAAEVAPLEGREVFGSVLGLLGAGVQAVLAGLWPLGDRETLPLMWSFYRQRLTCDLATALARAQREALSQPDSSPLFWAAFALFGDPFALPAPCFLWRWVQAWRQRRHSRRFVLPPLDFV
jgi:hypothetical protein